MQQRHHDRLTYFKEQVNTSREFYLNYLESFSPIREGYRVLEVGCGEAGNLLPFAQKGCLVMGIDLCETRIRQAKDFFRLEGATGQFLHTDFLDFHPEDSIRYQIILIHDVIEHIPQEKKLAFIRHAHELLAPEGLVFWGFPAWQMPFGGHQQICKSRWVSHFPFIHLFPRFVYRFMLRKLGAGGACTELLDIQASRLSIERFESLLRTADVKIINRTLWFINPHYKQKFHLTPRRLPNWISSLPYIRNFFSTSCFYLTCKISYDAKFHFLNCGSPI